MCTSNGAFWGAVWFFVVLLCAAIVLSLLTGCAYQTSRWSEHDGKIEYHQTNLTPPFGRQSESAGQMSVSVDGEGVWDLRIGRTDIGVDNTPQAEIAGKAADLLIFLGKLSATGGM